MLKPAARHSILAIPTQFQCVLLRPGCAGSSAAQTKSTSYSYDAVYGPCSSQESVFRDVEPVVISVMDGYNVCIFAYGQTGSPSWQTGYSITRVCCHCFCSIIFHAGMQGAHCPAHVLLWVDTPCRVLDATCIICTSTRPALLQSPCGEYSCSI